MSHDRGISSRTSGRLTRARLRPFVPLVVLAVFAALPYSSLSIPVLFDGPLNSPGSLQVLAICLVFGALALGYDLLFGRTGLLSFGHALYFAAGGYGMVILVNRTDWPLWMVTLLAVTGTAALAALLGAVALRTKGIAFAMVTLAFAQIGAITVGRNVGRATGGEEGLTLDWRRLPEPLVGVVNTVNRYWIALALVAIVAFVAHRVADSPAGRVLAAVRDDDRRVDVLGLSPYRYRLFAFVIAGALAGLTGVVYALLVGGVSPHITDSSLTLSVLVMVVLGGPGTRWGPLLGGAAYAFLDNRLGAVGTSETVKHLPSVLAGPLSQPLFILGAIFVLAVYFFPGGLAGLARRLSPLQRVLAPRSVKAQT
ncbi:MAG TPA: branched-chain amino acid ABC transporter permease [Micromonosporaceae bacterium]|jgi:branched-chain amino acid transport system permease protein